MRRTHRAATWIAPAVLAVAFLSACNSDSHLNSGPPAALTIVSGNDQFGVVSTALPQPFVVKVADTAGVGVPGVTVTWSLSGGTGTLSAPSSTTDNSGKASVTLTFATGAGTRTTRASTTAISTSANNATFTAIAAAPATRDDWITYGHDAQRTSTSQGSLPSPLTKQWRFAPPPPTADPYTVVFNALAAIDGIYLQWGSKGTFFGFGTGTNVDRISPAGARMWSNTSWSPDYNVGHWGSIFGNRFVYMDDGIGYLDVATGVRKYSGGVDWWGETLPDATGLYVVQNWHVDGPATFVGSLTNTGVMRWQKNKYGVTKADIQVSDQSGGLALMKGILFFDPLYWTSGTPPFSKGVYAFNASTGAQTAYVNTTPASHISADSNNVYLMENGSLVARAQSDLRVVWSAPGANGLYQAPLLANDLVIIGTSTRIVAYDRKTGAKRWTSPSNISLTYYSRGSAATYLAAALGSGTLIATANDGLHVFSLTNGHAIWNGTIAGISGVAANPIIVNDPASGTVLYVVDNLGLIALK